MAIINSKNYFGLEMNPILREKIIEKYVSEVGDEFKPLRKWYIEAYTTDTDLNYVLSKSAQDTIDKIKLDKPEKVLSLIIENADPGGATFLLNKDEFYRYLPVEDKGTKDLMCIYMKRVLVNHTKLGQPMSDYYITYESWRIRDGHINHPVNNDLPEILRFIKMMIFIKCSNVEVFEMKPNEKARPPQMRDKKWINKSGFNVILVNSDWNRLYIRTEEFKVRGHLRFQRHGPKNALVKLIWINPYVKQGYKRKVKN